MDKSVLWSDSLLLGRVAPLSKDYSEVKRISAIIDCFDVGLTRLFYAIIKRENVKEKTILGDLCNMSIVFQMEFW